MEVFKIVPLPWLHKMGGIPKSNNNIFINKFNDIFSYIIPKCLNFYPFCNTFQAIIIDWLLVYLVVGLTYPIKSKPHVIKGPKTNIGFNRPSLFHHMGVNHWHTSHFWHKLVAYLFIMGHWQPKLFFFFKNNVTTKMPSNWSFMEFF